MQCSSKSERSEEATHCRDILVSLENYGVQPTCLGFASAGRGGGTVSTRDTSSLMQWKQEWRGSRWMPPLGKRKLRSLESKRMDGRSHEQYCLNPDTTILLNVYENIWNFWVKWEKPSSSCYQLPLSLWIKSCKQHGQFTYHNWGVLGTARSMMCSELSTSMLFSINLSSFG